MEPCVVEQRGQDFIFPFALLIALFSGFPQQLHGVAISCYVPCGCVVFLLDVSFCRYKKTDWGVGFSEGSASWGTSEPW